MKDVFFIMPDILLAVIHIFLYRWTIEHVALTIVNNISRAKCNSKLQIVYMNLHYAVVTINFLI